MPQPEPTHSLKAVVLFKALDLFSGRSRPLDQRPAHPSGRRRNRTMESRGLAESSIQHRRNASNYQPPPSFQHLPPRTHCLTPSPSAHASPESQQQQSILLNIPREILLQIYEEVLGRELLHIVRRNGRLGHCRCRIHTPGAQAECIENGCRGLKLPSGLYARFVLADGGIISLLQTCRKIYIDTVEILYTSNIFDFDSMEGLIYFSIAILPHRFDSIQSLQLDFRFNVSFQFSESVPTDWARWLRTWQIISSMKALRHLWVRIRWHRQLSGAEEARCLDVLSLVSALETFEVTIPSLRSKEADEDNRPFHIVRLGR